MTKLEKELYQNLQKDGYLTPYMFPMIGENYGKKGKKKIVVLTGYVFQDDYVINLFSPYENSWKKNDKNNIKSDFIQYAWSHQKIDRKTPKKWFEEQKSGLSEKDIIYATYSRCPSKEKLNSNNNFLEILGALQNDLSAPCLKATLAAYNSLQCLLDVAQPDELWILGEYVKELISSQGNTAIEEEWISFKNHAESAEGFNCKINLIPLRKQRNEKKEGKSYKDICGEICSMLNKSFKLDTGVGVDNYNKLVKLKKLLEDLPNITASLKNSQKQPGITEMEAHAVLKKLDLFRNAMTRKRQPYTTRNA